MPLDLDEMFDALGRQADTVPLSGAGGARRRGQQRNRIRAVVSAAAAVVLVAVGAGVVLRNPDREALPAVVGTPMPQIGEYVELGNVARSIVATDRKRAYVAWIDGVDNGTQVKASDVETGMTAWTTGQPVVDPLRTLERLIVVPSAVLVTTRAADGTEPAVGLHAYDPLTGVPTWSKEADAADSLIFSDDMLVKLTARTGLVEGFDWVSGERRWARTDGAPVTRAVGMAVPDDEVKINRAGPPATFGDSRVVLLTGANAEVRNAASGDLEQIVPMSAPVGETMVAYDGWLATHDEPDSSPGPQSIRLTRLSGDDGTSLIMEKLTGRFIAMNACGKDRVCVMTQTPPSSPDLPPVTKLTAFSTARSQILWQRTSALGGDRISSANGATLITKTGGGLELYDANGELRFESPHGGGWMDARSLLVTAPDGTGRLARLDTTDARVTPYEPNALDLGSSCASTGQRLICSTMTALVTWKIG